MSGNGSTHAKILRIDARDNALVALYNLQKGEIVSFLGQDYTLLSDVQAKHKFLTQDVSAGGDIIMYGVLVGKAVENLRRGDLLSTRNIRHAAAAFHETESAGPDWTPPDISAWAAKTFRGFHRDDGQVGTRNYWLVLPLVFCENRNLAVLKQAFEEELGFAAPQIYRSQVAELARLYREGKADELKKAAFGEIQRASASPKVFQNIDGIKFLLHEAGCGGTHEDARNLCGLLAGYIHHPNVAGATVLSLGCQHAQVPMLLEEIKRRDPHFKKPVLIFEQQKSASEAAMLSRAIRETFLGMAEADKFTRQPAPLSKLTVALQCGGSDGFSGLSANPSIGHTADIVAALGGKGILSEFPELCGVEQQLIDRCVRKEVADRFAKLMRDYAARAKAVFASFEMNPSPGQYPRRFADGCDEVRGRGEERRYISGHRGARLSRVFHGAGPEFALHSRERCGIGLRASRSRRECGVVHYGPRHTDRKSDCSRFENCDEHEVWRSVWPTSSILTPAASSRAKPASRKWERRFLNA